jgi:hypothetical protein
VESRQIGYTFDGCGKFRGGSWSNKTNSKVMRVHAMETTVHCRLDCHCAPERSQLGKRGWKLRGNTTHIRSILDACAIYKSESWIHHSSSKVMRYHVTHKAIHCRLDWHAYTARSQLGQPGPGNSTWNHDSTFVPGAIYKGGRWSNTSSSKVMPFKRIETTVHSRLDWHCAPERSQLDNKEMLWKHDSFAPSFNEAVEKSVVGLGATSPVAK